jgi:rhamnogalacturonyl hydrolase YesR
MRTYLFVISISVILMIFSSSCGESGQKVAGFSGPLASDFIRRFPDPDVIHWAGQTNHFSWQAGYIMFAMEKMWIKTGDSAYFNYIRRYVDQQVDDAGNIPDFKNDALDNFLPGYAILFMYEQTGLEKYRIAATKVYEGFRGYPRLRNGLFWHSSQEWSRGQAWVDGVFMGQIFSARYGRDLNDASAFAQVTEQMSLILDKCRKPNGLLLHGWNEDKTAPWADKETGLAPEVWSEGLGWFAVLIADVFDWLPQNQPGRDSLMSALRSLCAGLKDCQDPKTGMWCQVVDKPSEAGNWNETSGTAMFIYLLQSAVNKDYISGEEYGPVIEKAYNGLVKKIVRNPEGYLDLLDCSSIGIMKSYAEYISQPKETSTFAAFGSVILGTGIFEN